MPWTLIDDGAANIEVGAAGMRKYYEWRRLIRDDINPRAAANQVGDTHYEQLGGHHRGVYTIRLSQLHRVVFTIAEQVVTVSHIGGHFP